MSDNSKIEPAPTTEELESRAADGARAFRVDVKFIVLSYMRQNLVSVPMREFVPAVMQSCAADKGVIPSASIVMEAVSASKALQIRLVRPAPGQLALEKIIVFPGGPPDVDKEEHLEWRDAQRIMQKNLENDLQLCRNHADWHDKQARGGPPDNGAPPKPNEPEEGQVNPNPTQDGGPPATPRPS